MTLRQLRHECWLVRPHWLFTFVVVILFILLPLSLALITWKLLGVGFVDAWMTLLKHHEAVTVEKQAAPFAGATLFLAAVHGAYRVINCCPLARDGYHALLHNIPWQPTHRLPLGPMRWSVGDLLPLCILMLLGYPWWTIPRPIWIVFVAFAIGYSLTLCFYLWRAERKRDVFCCMLAVALFVVVVVRMPEWTFVPTLLIAGASQISVHRLLPAMLQHRPFSSVKDKQDRKTRWGWPWMVLSAPPDRTWTFRELVGIGTILVVFGLTDPVLNMVCSGVWLMFINGTIIFDVLVVDLSVPPVSFFGAVFRAPIPMLRYLRILLPLLLVVPLFIVNTLLMAWAEHKDWNSAELLQWQLIWSFVFAIAVVATSYLLTGLRQWRLTAPMRYASPGKMRRPAR